MKHEPITLLVCALGGEGGGVLSEWLVDTARLAGYAAQATSVPGVAQRTGATTYYLEVFPVPIASLGGRRPVFSLNPVPGMLDAIVSSELLETARQASVGMSSPARTRVITSSARTLTTQERMQLADGRADSEALLQLVRASSRDVWVFDMGAAAKESGTVVSAVMLGAIAASGVFPFTREQYETVVRGSGASAEASLRGFARAFEQGGKTLDSRLRGNDEKPPVTPASPVIPASVNRTSHAIPAPPVIPAQAGIQRLATDIQPMAALGHARLVEYQGEAYAQLYLDRLQAVQEAEREADPSATAITNEMARWLALWMAFDDIVRVADLKSRASRWERVKREVKAADGDLVKLYDHFKPGIPEFAALLPQSLADRLTAWDHRRTARGRKPWALPLKIGTHGIAGMLALRTLASLKWLRVRGSRFAAEQRMIEKFLAGVIEGTRRDWRLGHEIAQCGRLIKGYGATNERGKDNLLHVLDHLALIADPQVAARAVANSREAALADDAGKALDAALVRHGAPPRPVKAVPIRFMRKPGSSAAARPEHTKETTV